MVEASSGPEARNDSQCAGLKKIKKKKEKGEKRKGYF